MHPQERHARIGELFLRACEFTEEAREEFLAGLSDADRAEVESLLRHERSDSPPPFFSLEGQSVVDPPTVLRQLRERLGRQTPGMVTDGGAMESSRGSTCDEGLLRTEVRCEPREELSRGGMGVVRRAWDPDLNRWIAIKTILGPDQVAERVGEGEADIAAWRLHRFLEEAQVTAQLDHPGVVPIHAIGLDARGRPFFAMREVRGSDLGAIFERVANGEAGWTRSRVLEVLVKVCDTLAYAHAKGVIHRDIKPSNVMIGAFGEVYVMDWGIAKVLGVKPGSPSSEGRAPEAVRTDRSWSTSDRPQSLLRTLDGWAIGTANFMSPEQARGRIAEMGPHSDVYSVGSMLYQLLTGRLPYVGSTSSASVQDEVEALLAGPPPPIEEIRRGVPSELVAICQKAMAREIERRYPSTRELAVDLRAYLENRVVAAHRTGALAELRKWVQRNPALASLGSAFVLALLVGAIVTLVLYRSAREANLRAQGSLRDARDFATAGIVGLLEQVADDRLWPPVRANLQEMDAWLKRAGALRDVLRRLEGSTSGGWAPGIPEGPRSLPRSWETEDEGSWRADHLINLIRRLRGFLAPRELEPGTLGIWGVSLAEVERRRAHVEAWAELTLESDDAREAWRKARAYALAVEGPYEFELRVREGLLPLWPPNPRTGLLEFWFVPSGERPELDPEWFWNGVEPRPGEVVAHPSRFLVRPEMGMVFVLVPGVRAGEPPVWLGAQRHDPTRPNFDPNAEDHERLHEVRPAPYWISKYEVTQAQWFRLRENRPSAFPDPQPRLVPAHPVEQVSWREVDQFARRWGLQLPTEEQWERACRGGTSWPFWSGEVEATLEGAANLADETTRDARSLRVPWDDGYWAHAPVGSFRPNPFGLHDMHGNVWEWCRDVSAGDFADGGESLEHRVCRGGSFYHPSSDCRAGNRNAQDPSLRVGDLGFRLALDG